MFQCSKGIDSSMLKFWKKKVGRGGHMKKVCGIGVWTGETVLNYSYWLNLYNLSFFFLWAFLFFSISYRCFLMATLAVELFMFNFFEALLMLSPFSSTSLMRLAFNWIKREILPGWLFCRIFWEGSRSYVLFHSCCSTWVVYLNTKIL